MIRHLSIAALLLLAACGDGQPFEFDPDAETPAEDGAGDGAEDGENGGDGGSIEGDGTPPEGTSGPSAGPDESIFRSEARDESGGGFVTEVVYSAASDSFTVDNLAFDGDNTYERQDGFDSLGGYALYDSIGDLDDPTSVNDPETGAQIQQFDYRAIYGVSRNQVLVDGRLEPRSRFAIVRTGSYRDYGFGGFVYERNGDVELPAGGQAFYAGDYAGIRVFRGAGGLEYTSGDIAIAVDFEDFNEGEGVRGTVSNRRIYDSGGTEIRTASASELPDDDALIAPPLNFEVGPGALRANGEIGGGVSNTRVLESGLVETYEQGTYLGIIGGEAEEIVGIIVIDSEDPRFEDVTVRETGGFVVYR